MDAYGNQGGRARISSLHLVSAGAGVALLEILSVVVSSLAFSDCL